MRHRLGKSLLQGYIYSHLRSHDILYVLVIKMELYKLQVICHSINFNDVTVANYNSSKQVSRYNAIRSEAMS